MSDPNVKSIEVQIIDRAIEKLKKPGYWVKAWGDGTTHSCLWGALITSERELLGRTAGRDFRATKGVASSRLRRKYRLFDQVLPPTWNDHPQTSLEDVIKHLEVIRHLEVVSAEFEQGRAK